MRIWESLCEESIRKQLYRKPFGSLAIEVQVNFVVVDFQ